MEIITALLRNLERSVRNSPPGEDQSASSPVLAFQVNTPHILSMYRSSLTDSIVIDRPHILRSVTLKMESYISAFFFRMLSSDRWVSTLPRCLTSRRRRTWLWSWRRCHWKPRILSTGWHRLTPMSNISSWRHFTSWQRNRQGIQLIFIKQESLFSSLLVIKSCKG